VKFLTLSLNVTLNFHARDKKKIKEKHQQAAINMAKV